MPLKPEEQAREIVAHSIPRDEAKSFLALCQDIAVFCERELSEFGVVPKDKPSELLVVLFARSIELYLGVLRLASHGHPAAARIVARSLLEASFFFRAAYAGKVTPVDLVSEHARWREKLMNKLQNQFSAELREGFVVTDELRDEIVRMSAEVGSGKLSVEEVARRADAHDEYLLAFERLSSTVHVTKRDLHQQFVRLPDGGSRLVVISDDVDVTTVALAAQKTLVMAVDVAEMNGRDVEAEAAQLITGLQPFTARGEL